MKQRTWQSFVTDARRADVKNHRAQMRAFALRARCEIAPDMSYHGSFVTRTERAAELIGNAIFYRNLAAQVAASAAKWESEVQS